MIKHRLFDCTVDDCSALQLGCSLAMNRAAVCTECTVKVTCAVCSLCEESATTDCSLAAAANWRLISQPRPIACVRRPACLR